MVSFAFLCSVKQYSNIAVHTRVKTEYSFIFKSLVCKEQSHPDSSLITLIRVLMGANMPAGIGLHIS